MTQNLTDSAGQEVANSALANAARLLALLGQTDQIDALAAQAKNRPLTAGPLGQMYQSALERSAAIRQRPQDFISCGPSALDQVSRVLKGAFADLKNAAPPALSSGYSLTELATLAKANQLDLVPVQWAAGQALPVPCVIHYQLGLYGAVLSRRDDWYQVSDAAFDHPVWIDEKTLAAESSGYVLAPASKVPTSWPVLSSGVADKVLGNSYPGNTI